MGVSGKLEPDGCAGEHGGKGSQTRSDARSPWASSMKLKSVHLKLKFPKMALQEMKGKKRTKTKN